MIVLLGAKISPLRPTVESATALLRQSRKKRCHRRLSISYAGPANGTTESSHSPIFPFCDPGIPADSTELADCIFAPVCTRAPQKPCGSADQTRPAGPDSER